MNSISSVNDPRENNRQPKGRLSFETLVSVVGLQFGDEGKGRVITVVEHEAGEGIAFVAKINGGANSGHTVNTKAGDQIKLNLLPSGIIEADRKVVLGKSVVADPLKLNAERAMVESFGITTQGRIFVDYKTQISTICERVLDLLSEKVREIQTGQGRGSTGRGISPAYALEAEQQQIFAYVAINDKKGFSRELGNRVTNAEIKAQGCSAKYPDEITQEVWKNFFKTISGAEIKANRGFITKGVFTESDFDYTKFCGEKPFTFNVRRIRSTYASAVSHWKDMLCSVQEMTFGAEIRKQIVVCEHGQATWLDKTHGLNPNTTASHTTPAEDYHSLGVPTGIGITVIGVVKAYGTKVGKHFNLARFNPNHLLPKKLQPFEYGATTGRQRFVHPYNAPEVARSLRLVRPQLLCINKVDVMSFEKGRPNFIKVCYGYRSNSDKKYIPISPDTNKALRDVGPLYLKLPGWTEEISGIRNWKKLPKACKDYLAVIYTLSVLNAGLDFEQIPTLAIIGVGPGESDSICDAPKKKKLLKRGIMLLQKRELELPRFENL